MGRTAYIVMLSMLAAGCAGWNTPRRLSAPAPASGGFQCALQHLESWGYRVTMSEKGSGIIRADKPGATMFGDSPVIQVAVGRDSLRATAALEQHEGGPMSWGRPPKGTVADARALLKDCGRQ